MKGVRLKGRNYESHGLPLETGPEGRWIARARRVSCSRAARSQEGRASRPGRVLDLPQSGGVERGERNLSSAFRRVADVIFEDGCRAKKLRGAFSRDTPRTERETARASKQIGAVGFAFPATGDDSGCIKANDRLANLAYYLHSLIYFDSTDCIEESGAALQHVKGWRAHRDEVLRLFGEQSIVAFVAGRVIFVDRSFEDRRVGTDPMRNFFERIGNFHPPSFRLAHELFVKIRQRDPVAMQVGRSAEACRAARHAGRFAELSQHRKERRQYCPVA
jgi:hypothetical protein